MKKGSIVFEFVENLLQIKQGKTQLSLKTIEGELPRFPQKEGKSSLKFNGELIKSAFEKVAIAIDSNSPKYEITGSLISITKESINFVSTDTKRLVFVEEKSHFEDIEELELILPKSAIIEIPKLFYNDVEFFYDTDSLVIQNNELYFFTRLINGKYPNWKRIIPDTFNYEYQFDVRNAVENIKQISFITDEIKVEMNANNVILETLADGTSKAQGETEFEVDFNFEKIIQFGVSSKYVLDALSLFSDEVSFGFNESNRPFVVSKENTKVVVMPVNI
jgi:DNA polymerase-3 subunit beta